MPATPLHVGISTKAYLSSERSLEWLTEVAAVASAHPGVVAGRVAVFLAPSAPLLAAAVQLTVEGPVRIASQDVSRFGRGAYTGETPAELLAELGVKVVEIGHAERRALLGETDAVVGEKALQAQAHGLTPLLCVGEESETTPEEAASFCLAQIRVVRSAPLMIAYEPVWAIGAERPAPAEHVRATVELIRAGLPDALTGSPIVYGGSAGPGLLSRVRPSVDGLFLGRFAHDPGNVRIVLDEADALTGHPSR